ncbi:hypothetical protein BDQ17DRAFT_1432627 [Cyathus striatus]|nr:hypothetical protein BDQ17DRAFT_1432627 [Cyathus striatus]
MAFKRAGKGQDPRGINGTVAENWQDAGPLLFLYTMFLAVDANFKLKGKDRKLDDIDLLTNKEAFVDQSEYLNHIQNYNEQSEMNMCQSKHDAIVRASTCSTPGYAVSSTALVLCSRHSLVRRNGVGDLQKGERYCNVHFAIFSTLIGVNIARVLLTYDIACQWSINWKKWNQKFPEHMWIPDTMKFDTAIPSRHINGHGQSCRQNFSLRYITGVVRTCGEEIESSWYHTNPLAASEREMGPAACRETLNDYWTGWNSERPLDFFSESVIMMEKHDIIFGCLSATFPPELIAKWTSMINTWEMNPSTAPNLYEEPENREALQNMQLELSQEESAEIVAGELPLNKVTKTGFLITGFELEDKQYQLHCQISNQKTSTAKWQADIQEKRNALLTRIHNWRQVQLSYTPQVASLLATSSAYDENGVTRVDNTEHIPLFMPSALPSEARLTPNVKQLCAMEARLHLGEWLWQFKKVNISGTGNRPNTHSNQISYKIEQVAHRYNQAYLTLSVLDPDGNWSENLRPLKKEDIRGPGKGPDDEKTSNGSSTDDGFHITMRVEWAKQRARMIRWKEEYQLVQEEMQRVTEGSSDVLHGVAAYTYKQANILQKMAKKCTSQWLPILRKNGIEPDWPLHHKAQSLSLQELKQDGTNEAVQNDYNNREEIDDDEHIGSEEENYVHYTNNTFDSFDFND